MKKRGQEREHVECLLSTVSQVANAIQDQTDRNGLPGVAHANHKEKIRRGNKEQHVAVNVHETREIIQTNKKNRSADEIHEVNVTAGHIDQAVAKAIERF